MELSEIRNDLRDIKYYFSRKKIFDEGCVVTGHNLVIEKVRKYNEIIVTAKPQLYDIYVCLYIKNHTQQSLADYFGYSYEYICVLNKELILFFQEKLS